MQAAHRAELEAERLACTQRVQAAEAAAEDAQEEVRLMTQKLEAAAVQCQTEARAQVGVLQHKLADSEHACTELRVEMSRLRARAELLEQQQAATPPLPSHITTTTAPPPTVVETSRGARVLASSLGLQHQDAARHEEELSALQRQVQASNTAAEQAQLACAQRMAVAMRRLEGAAHRLRTEQQACLEAKERAASAEAQCAQLRKRVTQLTARAAESSHQWHTDRDTVTQQWKGACECARVCVWVGDVLRRCESEGGARLSHHDCCSCPCVSWHTNRRSAMRG